MKWFFRKKQPDPINQPYRVFYQDNHNQLLFWHYFHQTPEVGGTVKRFWPKVDLEISAVDEVNHTVFVRGLVS